MKIKCDYCGNMIEDTDKVCPSCGAENAHFKKETPRNSTPKTIAELRAWYQKRNLPSEEVTRFFIGKDIKEPKAFGIYRDESTGEFVVYKNKDTGARAERYRGTDEAYAVNELYLKLQSEIIQQKERNRQSGRTNHAVKSEKGGRKHTFRERMKSILDCMVVMIGLGIMAMVPGLITAILIGAFVTIAVVIAWSVKFNGTKYEIKRTLHIGILYALIVVLLFPLCFSYSGTRYYKYEDTVYCYSHWNYFEYEDDIGDYSLLGDKSALPAEMQTDLDPYVWNAGEADWDGFTAFEDSDYYDENYASSDSSDSDYDWDSGDSWDSGGTDWGSDW